MLLNIRIYSYFLSLVHNGIVCLLRMSSASGRGSDDGTNGSVEILRSAEEFLQESRSEIKLTNRVTKLTELVKHFVFRYLKYEIVARS